MPTCKFSAAFCLLGLLAITIPAHARTVPERVLPKPATVSPEMADFISAPIQETLHTHPENTAEWQKVVKQINAEVIQLLPELKQKLEVGSQAAKMDNVPIYVITPKEIAPENRDRVLLHIHGGGYVLNPGETGTPEAMLMAHHGKIKVVSVDYRMAPEYSYPAAHDDVLTVYKALLKDYPAEKIGVFGTSTGGGMTLALPLRAKAAGLPMPGAIAPATPWCDITKTGDTYFANENVDNILDTYDTWLDAAAKAYANGHDMRDPILSPIYGDVSNFPPTLLTSGTRDLLLSNTVRMQKKLREANVPVDLIVHEALPHAAYYMVPFSPEAAYHFREHAKFFDKWLK